MNGADKKIRKFYFLSILCLLPVLGIIIGIVLCCFAIFRFKSVALFMVVLVMTTGGVFMIKLDSNYLRNEMRYGKDSDNLNILLAQNDLDEIAKSCESYKLKHGTYPDSLQQLEKENTLLSITDPILDRNPDAHKFIYFYYKKTDQGYILFSSGLDAIPNTRDDIYPRKTLK
jgi:hypothetical protein